MGKISVKYNKKKSFTKIEHKIKYPEVINQKLQKAINLCVYDCFLPISIEKYKENKKAVLVCEVKDLVPLSEYMKIQFNKEQFLNLIRQLICIIRICEDNLLSVNNIELRKDCIFIQESTGFLKCIYWPLVNYQSYISYADFFRNIVKELSFSSDVSLSFTKKYSSFFSDLIPFSINDFERMVNELSGIQNKKNIDNYMTLTANNNQSSFSDNEQKDDEFYNPLMNRRKRITKKIIIDDVGPLAKPINKGHKKYHAQEFGFPVLYRLKNSEKISINKPKFIVGKDDKACSYVISGNSAISRVHAIISKIGNKYYIQDNKSTNRTFVNNNVIYPFQNVEINDGDYIKLANENFVFHCN